MTNAGLEFDFSDLIKPEFWEAELQDAIKLTRNRWKRLVLQAQLRKQQFIDAVNLEIISLPPFIQIDPDKVLMLEVAVAFGGDLDDFFDEGQRIWTRASLRVVTHAVTNSLTVKKLKQRVMTLQGAYEWALLSLSDAIAQVVSRSPYEVVMGKLLFDFVEWLQKIRLPLMAHLAKIVEGAPFKLYLRVLVLAIALATAVPLFWTFYSFATQGASDLKLTDLPQPGESDYVGRWAHEKTPPNG